MAIDTDKLHSQGKHQESAEDKQSEDAFNLSEVDRDQDESKQDKEDNDKPDKGNFFSELKEKAIELQTVSLRDKIFFVQNLSIMIRSGLSISQAFKTISKQIKNSLFKKVLINISQKVQSGVSLSEAMSAYPKIFNHLFVNMIKSGELSGNLEDVLGKLHTQMKRDHDLISKVKGAMIYPLVVIIAMIGIGIAMMVFVVPKLIGIFEEFDAELPLPTQILIGVSKFITTNGFFVILASLILVVVFVKYYRSESGKKIFHKVFLYIPILSGIVRKINLARFCRTTSSLLKTDISIVKSFEITSQVVGNYYYQQALEEVSGKITKGVQINKILAEYPKLFSSTVIQMVKVGEESGAIDTTLEEVATFYEEDVNNVMENLPSIIEPVLILILGLGVGAMAVAIIMPMYSLTQTF